MSTKPAVSNPAQQSRSGVPTMTPSRTSATSEDLKPQDSDGQDQTDVEAGTMGTPSFSPDKEKDVLNSQDAVKGNTLSRRADTKVEQRSTEDDGTEYPTGMPLALIMLALCLSVFLMSLGKPYCQSPTSLLRPNLHSPDNTIIATAIPKITDQFQSLPDVGWYASCKPSCLPVHKANPLVNKSKPTSSPPLPSSSSSAVSTPSSPSNGST
jgi:hypothetical protein